MTRDIVIQLLEKQPFEPLELTLSNNDHVLIEDPETAIVGRNYLVVPGSSPKTRLTITLHHIISIESVSEPSEDPH